MTSTPGWDPGSPCPRPALQPCFATILASLVSLLLSEPAATLCRHCYATCWATGATKEEGRDKDTSESAVNRAKSLAPDAAPNRRLCSFCHTSQCPPIKFAFQPFPPPHPVHNLFTTEATTFVDRYPPNTNHSPALVVRVFPNITQRLHDPQY